jgi:hypothetical protein
MRICRWDLAKTEQVKQEHTNTTKMSKKHERYKDADGETMDAFYEILQVMTDEHLLRFRKRLEMVGRKEMVKILTTEIEERENKERELAK